MTLRQALISCALIVLQMDSGLAQPNATGNGTTQHNFTSDPFLQYQPPFSRSLPVQLLINGIVLTLTTTLLIQLCFTWQYHWPLARINWTLQFTGACILLLNIIAILYVVLCALSEKSKQWPYMFEYVAIDVPRVGTWTIPEIAAWYVMETATSTLASITHIQFLTFLYPSRLEARLVFLLLGPLAVVASIMTLLPISTYCYSTNSSNSTLNATAFNATLSQFNNSTLGGTLLPNLLALNLSSVQNTSSLPSNQRQLLDIFDAARNICNLTLSLLFTLSLLIWGFLVNRRSAWRTDGGTAAFGAGALFLALVSTILNFLNVFSTPRYEWLSSLLWAVVLWQSFLGWWWWVGSASGIAARDFDMEKRGRKEQKRAKRKRRKVASLEDEPIAGGTTARLDRWRSSMGVTLSRRRPPASHPTQPSQSQTSTLQGDTIELTPISSILSTPSDSPPQAPTSSIPTSPRAMSYSTQFFTAAHRAWRALRQAHVRAARVQAIEQRQIQIQLELENGRGLGRFPGGTGGERDRSALRCDGMVGVSDGEGAVIDSLRGAAETQLHRDYGGGTMRWWRPLKKWRLRDSTSY